MLEWDEMTEQVTKIAPDKEKAKALLQIIALREKNIALMNTGEFATLIVEDYYDIMKELITAIMSVDGWKTVSHEMLIGYLARFYKEFSQAELYAIDQLRKTRNDISYRGAKIKPDYLTRNGELILKIIGKLKQTVERKIK
ncbi:MAG: hypothetical protein HZB66_00295 [Candidatus Aenigmarchaeota archaeon]|nr:hypothetical protein [Candidatus Aenigmarchaeota archaeon]